MKLKVGSYVKFRQLSWGNDAFGFITKVNETNYEVSWVGIYQGIVTDPREIDLVVLANPSKLTDLLFL
jgi:hypothetical protein